MARRDLASAREQVRGEMRRHEIQRDHQVRQAEFLCVPAGKGDFPGVVFGAVVEAQRAADFMVRVRLVEGRHRVHPAAEQHDHLHSGKLASTLTVIPPRAANSPCTLSTRGWQQAARSSRIRLTTSSLKLRVLRNAER